MTTLHFEAVPSVQILGRTPESYEIIIRFQGASEDSTSPFERVGAEISVTVAHRDHCRSHKGMILNP